MTVVRNATNNGYFIISSDGYTIKTYKITTSGLDINPIISNINNTVGYPPFNIEDLFTNRNSTIIRFSPDNLKMGQLIISDGFFIGPNTSSSRSNFFTIDFNNTTGVFSNFISVDLSLEAVGAYRNFEFSKDSKKVYLVRNSIFVKNLLNISAPARNLFETNTSAIADNFLNIQKDKFGEMLLNSVSNVNNLNKYFHRIENQDSFLNSTVSLNYIFLNNNSFGTAPNATANKLPQLISNVPVVIQNFSCGNTNIVVSANVSSGFDNRQATTIIASNTISSGATALYHAENSVTLTSGFSAVTGSLFRGYIEGCNGLFSAKVNNSNSKTLTESKQENANSNLLTLIYPNPNNGNFRITLNNNYEGETVVRVYNLMGKIVYDSIEKLSIFDLKIDNLQTGLYIVNLEGNNYQETLKFIKE